ncbi:4-hydroxybenzoate polyprenyltransferase [Fodinibius roseus]|uniref:4-hydroxybenzoate polyprenyltransferase n=1 Tax=Fodinibius roseus TaxID=1194090 RepID=A0A1M4XSK9_9BACT|nr:UbiA family prenyltransferase [Fodinibius roseus]SHE96479.1 4-hydroxybenzoate polyprenyltransferase [Fodinibius roseus]
MAESNRGKAGWGNQVWHFVLHLRLHYQLFILSGAYLLGALLSENFNLQWFVIQFLNVHLLLFGGATAYNSFWDRDEGPVGGLPNPPPMVRWMWFASLLIQMIGLLLAIPMGAFFVGIYLLSMLLFWLYSSPWSRWKGRPLKSLVAIGISTGCNAVLLGYYATGFGPLYGSTWMAAAGVTFILLSLYPVSQLYQQNEDLRRGDRTFAVSYGKYTVMRFFEASFTVGLLLVTLAIGLQHLMLGLLFGITGGITGILVDRKLKGMMAHNEGDYRSVMQVKYRTSMAFVSFLVIALFAKHNDFLNSFAFVEWLLK